VSRETAAAAADAVAMRRLEREDLQDSRSSVPAESNLRFGIDTSVFDI
jgi:hypothetical protein